MPSEKELAQSGYFGFHAPQEDAAVKYGAVPAEDKAAKPKSKKGYPKHSGGGWYTLSSGEKVHGKKAAAKAEAKLGG